MRQVKTRAPSFPTTAENEGLLTPGGVRWHVVCGDQAHWRAGMYSPSESSLEQIGELERHDCPELFLLIKGRLTLVLSEGKGGVRELALEPGVPVLVTAPHTGYCPDGPFTGVAFVVERDAFDTEYRAPAEWNP